MNAAQGLTDALNAYTAQVIGALPMFALAAIAGVIVLLVVRAALR